MIYFKGLEFKELKKNKLFYTIGEVANYFEVNTSLIRFWQQEFKSINPKKNNNGNRVFTKKDIEKLKKIYTLVKIKGFTLEGAKKVIKNKNYDDTIKSKSSEINEKLLRLRFQLLELKSEL